jgi:cell division protease FtsH
LDRLPCEPPHRAAKDRRLEMTDQDTNLPVPDGPGSSFSTNGHSPAGAASVRSGLAHRRNPLRVRLGELAQAVRRIVLRDPLALFLLLASIGLAIAFAMLLGQIKPASSGTQAPLSTVQKLAKHHEVATATLLDHDSRVVLETTGSARSKRPKGSSTGGTAETSVPIGVPQRLWAAYPSSGAQTEQLANELSSNGATVAIDQQSGKPTKAIVVQFLIPILLLVCLFSFFMRLGGEGAAGGIAGFSEFTGKGRKKGKGKAETITFADVAGAGEALAELREIRDYLADPSKYLAVGAAAPKGVLLVGPPGTGKTLLAKAVAGEADASFFSLSGSDFVESLVGVGAARVRDLFRKARKAAPAIIFIDELDAAGRKRGAGIGQGNDEREQTLNQILVEMDGFAGDGGLVVMGATNRPDILDPALLRPGRFDRQIVVDVPDVHGRIEILRLHGGKRPMAPDASLEEVARQTPGFSGAELANVINEAALLSVRDGRGQIDQATLEEAIDRVVAGPAKRHILTEDERWLIAIHESSHAVVTDALGHTASTRKLSIVARGRQLGTAAHMLTDRDHGRVGWGADRLRADLDERQRRPPRRHGARSQHGHLLWHVRGAGFGDDRREGRRGVPRRLAAGSRLGRPGDAQPDRQRDRAARRRRRGARGGRPGSQLEHRRGDGVRAARAGDALRRGARRGAVDRA